MNCKHLLSTIVLLLCAQSLFSASHHPQTFLKQIAGSKDEGKQIVQHFCINCHAEKPLIPLGAPRIGIAADWKPRLKQSMTVLFRNTSEGLNAMPARGGCFECTDEQLILSIMAMLPESLLVDFNRQQSPQKKH